MIYKVFDVAHGSAKLPHEPNRKDRVVRPWRTVRLVAA